MPASSFRCFVSCRFFSRNQIIDAYNVRQLLHCGFYIIPQNPVAHRTKQRHSPVQNFHFNRTLRNHQDPRNGICSLFPNLNVCLESIRRRQFHTPPARPGVTAPQGRDYCIQTMRKFCFKLVPPGTRIFVRVSFHNNSPSNQAWLRGKFLLGKLNALYRVGCCNLLGV